MDDVAPDAPLRVKISDRLAIGVYQDGEDYFAMDDRCPHMGGFISQGPFDGARATCPIHGFRIDVRDGSCEQGRQFSVSTYPVTRRGNMLIIEIARE